MKYIYLCFSLLLFTTIFAQTSPITFDESWTVNGPNWTIQEDQGTTVSIAADPESSGTRGNTLQVNYLNTGQVWQNAQIKLTEGQHRFSVGSSKTITFDVYTDHTGDPSIGMYTGMLKLEQGENATHTALEYSFPVSGTGWETITIDTTTDKNGNTADGEYALMVLFTNYGTGLHKMEDTRYYDNITFTDGSVISSDPFPATAAPTPTPLQANVFNIYSDHYTDTTVWADNEIRAGWSNGEISEYSISDQDVALKFKGANFIGQYWTTTTNARGQMDLSSYETFSFDVYVDDLEADKTIQIAWLGNDEKLVSATVTAGAAGWRTIQVPFGEWSDTTDLSAIDGIKWEPNPQGSIPVFYVDNIYAFSAPSDNTVVTFTVDTNDSPYPNADYDTVVINGDWTMGQSAWDGYGVTLYDDGTNGDETAADGIHTGTLTLPKDTGDVEYVVAVTGVADTFSGWGDQSGQSTICVETAGNFSFTTGLNNVGQSIKLLQDNTTEHWACLSADAVAEVTFIVRGLYPGTDHGQYGITPPGGSAYQINDIVTEDPAGVRTGVASIAFYTEMDYQVHFNNTDFGWDNANTISKNADTNSSFSISVVEADLTEDLTVLGTVNSDNNWIVYSNSNSLSINGLDAEFTFSMYPNPVQDKVRINSANQIDAIQIFDLSGRSVLQKTLNARSPEINVAALNSGVYFLKATMESNSKVIKFQKK